ncbi:MAG TPA: DsbA family protein [Patescibacteria group bacterium]|nr:DsbA family protein [Patescibacteria group bacterium]
MDSPLPQLPWYRKGWGVILITFLLFLLTILLIFVVITVRYWWKIAHGQGDVLREQFASSFTSSVVGKAPTATFDLKKLVTPDDPFLGRPGAPVVIVEFVDFKCPNCKTAAPIIREVAKQYGYTVHIILRDFPAESIHPGATRFSELAYCAQRQGRFWEMHDLLFSEQDQLGTVLSLEQLQALANLAGVDFSKLKECLAAPTTAAEVNADYIDGVTLGVRGTPTFFVNGEKVEGVVPFEGWKKYLDAFVRSQ